MDFLNKDKIDDDDDDVYEIWKKVFVDDHFHQYEPIWHEK